VSRRICTFDGCNKIIIDKDGDLCPSCIYKVCRYEESLDRWLATFYPDLSLEDLNGWYCKCVRDECVRDCLDVDYYYPGCECCPCNLKLTYISRKINNRIMPNIEWMEELLAKIDI